MAKLVAGPAQKQRQTKTKFAAYWCPWEINRAGDEVIYGMDPNTGLYDPQRHSRNGIPVGSWRYMGNDLSHRDAVHEVEDPDDPTATIKITPHEAKGWYPLHQARMMFPRCEEKLADNWLEHAAGAGHVSATKNGLPLREHIARAEKGEPAEVTA